MIKFNVPKCISYIIVVYIFQTYNNYFLQKNEFKNPFYCILCMSIGEFFAFILFIFEKKLNKSKFSEESTKSHYWFFKILLLCSIIDIFCYYDYSALIYNYRMKKTNEKYNFFIQPILFVIFFIFNENYLLKIRIYIHHCLAFIIALFGLILYLIFEIFNNENNKFDVISFILILIFRSESEFLKTLNYIVPKKLNNEYFLSMNFIIFIKGLIGFILCLIIILIFKLDFIKEFLEKEIKTIVEIVGFIISCFISRVFSLKIAEKSRPSYNLISQGLSYFTLFIVTNEKKNYSFYILILFLLISILIYCEVIVIKIFNLDKYTINEISKRGFKGVINDISLEFISNHDNEVININDNI